MLKVGFATLAMVVLGMLASAVPVTVLDYLVEKFIIGVSISMILLIIYVCVYGIVSPLPGEEDEDEEEDIFD